MANPLWAHVRRLSERGTSGIFLPHTAPPTTPGGLSDEEEGESLAPQEEIPPLMDVLANKSQEPVSLRSLLRYARRNVSLSCPRDRRGGEAGWLCCVTAGREQLGHSTRLQWRLGLAPPGWRLATQHTLCTVPPPCGVCLLGGVHWLKGETPFDLAPILKNSEPRQVQVYAVCTDLWTQRVVSSAA